LVALITLKSGEGGFCCSLIGDKLFEWLNPPLHLLIFSIIKLLDIGKKYYKSAKNRLIDTSIVGKACGEIMP